MSSKSIASTDRYPVKNPKVYSRVSNFIFNPYINLRGHSVNGLENLPETAPYIIAASHRSGLDIPVLGKVLLEHESSQIHFIAKKELWEAHDEFTRLNRKKIKIGSYLSGKLGNFMGDLFSHVLEECGAIKYDRDKQMPEQPEVTERVDEVLSNNGILGIFPERTRKKGREIQIEQKGLGYLAVKKLVPIVPIAMAGTENKWGPMFTEIGSPVWPGPVNLNSRREVFKRAVEVEEQYTANLQELYDTALQKLAESS